MNYIRRAAERGKANFGWLDSKHSFSFGHYYDPQHMGVSVLRVINDDTVAPGHGFEQHGHKDMEIISYVTQGALKHQDSTGNNYVVPAGDIQRMSAGRGVLHSEYNASDTEEVKFLQIWIMPEKKGIAPDYEQKSITQTETLTPLVNPQGTQGALSINQQASIFRLVLNKDEAFTLSPQEQAGYLHIIKGRLSVKDRTFDVGDAFSIEACEDQQISSLSDNFEALWFTLPASR
ncbi:pirin family protein [Alteromonas lipotrueiana]|uniref:pirin family protein n=1 Tax=Alteromonas lipotrueiana TaxID=2803815 RepID=UPI001C461E04|nr:pirin-like bicupin family protein [Alteromonas lipotrueiana]